LISSSSWIKSEQITSHGTISKSIIIILARIQKQAHTNATQKKKKKLHEIRKHPQKKSSSNRSKSPV
jgi:hypothetical protein